MLGVLGVPRLCRATFEGLPSPSRLGEEIGQGKVSQIARDRDVGWLNSDHRSAECRGDLLAGPFQEADEALPHLRTSRLCVADAKPAKRCVEDIVDPAREVQVGAANGRKRDAEMLAPLVGRSSLCRRSRRGHDCSGAVGGIGNMCRSC
jgi:hypothetical protein